MSMRPFSWPNKGKSLLRLKSYTVVIEYGRATFCGVNII